MRISSESSSKIEDVELVPTGMELCTLYSIVDLGTQSTNFGDKPQIRLLFEFPQHMRVFYEGSDARPSVISATETKSLSTKANLRKKLIEPMLGKGLTEQEAKDFNPEVLLGRHFVATIIHSPDGKWANIGSIMPLNTKTMTMFGLTEPKIAQINESLIFDIEEDGFMSEKFGKLPNNLRSKIMDSNEGQAHKASGGKFHDPIRNDDNNGGGNSNQGGAGKKLVMNPDSPYSYEQLKGADWTDQQIVDNGHGKWQVATPPPAPQAAPTPPPAPAPAPVPQAPAPQATPQAPQATQAPATPTPSPATPATPQAPQGIPQAPPAAPKNHPIKMRNPELQGKIDDYLKQGWTYETLVENSIADFIQE